MSVSLDHQNEETNDRRRFKGSHKLALRAIENALSVEAYIQCLLSLWTGKILKNWKNIFIIWDKLGFME